LATLSDKLQEINFILRKAAKRLPILRMSRTGLRQHGSGRYNLAQGAASTATGVGAAVSTFAAGLVTQVFGYTIGFLLLALIGGAGLAIIYFLLPETMPQKFP
jgi:MFS family permease